MNLRISGFLLAILPAIALSVAAINRPEVNTYNGVVRGDTVITTGGKRVHIFYGIPFAKPPVADLRFKRPVPYTTKWTTPFEATKPPNACSQSVGNSFPNFAGEAVWNPNTPMSEDCLYLNVWVPESQFKKKTNVFFWLYGGGYYSGSSSLDIYNGATLAAEKDVIVVSANYRLGPLGFLYYGTDDAPGNMGLLDQNLALRWTNENIAAFGGDPAEITLFGESAGSASVSYHLLSPLSQNLFKRAVLMSGVATACWAFRTPEKAIDTSNAIAKEVGCWVKEDNATNTPHEIVECLRRVDSDTFNVAQWKNYHGFMELPLSPTIDGYFLLEEPADLVQKWDTKRSDLIIGNTAHEGTYFILYKYLKYFNLLKRTSVPYDGFLTIMRDVFREWPAHEIDAIIYQYSNWENLEDGYVNQHRISDAVGDAFFNCPLRQFADSWSGRGLKVYYYFFTQHTASDPWGKWMGVKHADEIAYFFGQPLAKSEKYTPEEQQLSRKAMDLLSNFAKTGIPSKSWERYSREFPYYLDLNATVISDETSPSEYGPRAEACAFWNIALPQLREAVEAKEECVLDTAGTDLDGEVQDSARTTDDSLVTVPTCDARKRK